MNFTLITYIPNQYDCFGEPSGDSDLRVFSSEDKDKIINEWAAHKVESEIYGRNHEYRLLVNGLEYYDNLDKSQDSIYTSILNSANDETKKRLAALKAKQNKRK